MCCLQDQLQQSKVAHAAMVSNVENVSELSDENRKLKDEAARRDQEAARLTLELQSVRRAADVGNSAQSSSAQLAVENESLKAALAEKTADLQASLSELDNKHATSNTQADTMLKTIQDLAAENKALTEKLDQKSKQLPWSAEDQEQISQLSIENSLLKEQLRKKSNGSDSTDIPRLEGEIKILKENLEHEHLMVADANARLKEAHEKEVQAHQQLHELQAFDRDHDYWPQVLKRKDDEIIQLREHVERLSGDNRRLIADNQEMKTRFELGRAALSSEVNLHKEKASHHEAELKKRIEEVEKRAIAAAEGYHASLQALDAERNELRRDLHESQHLLADAKQKCYQIQQEKVQAEAELVGMRKPVKAEQEWKQQVRASGLLRI